MPYGRAGLRMKGLQTLTQRPHTAHTLNMMTSVSVLSSSLVNKRFLDFPEPVLGKEIMRLGKVGVFQ